MTDVPQAGPTCPLSDEEIQQTYWEERRGPDWDRNSRRAIALAVVAADRARLRAYFVEQSQRDDEYNGDALACFDSACVVIDATTRRA